MSRQTADAVANHANAPGTGNLFLDTLAPASLARLRPLLTHGELKAGRVLGEPAVAAKEVHFPVASLISTISRMANGAAVEVGLAGREGLSPISLAFGSTVGSHSVVVQISDSAWSMGAASFAEQMEGDAALRKRASLYAQYVYAAAAQFAACNRLHSLEARYARWLLMAADRVAGREFTLTQEYSSQMLGVRRAGVTHAAGEMSNAGLIASRRGHITVLDRAGLEETSCECYGLVNAELRRLMGYGIAHPAKAGSSAA